jgi:hypothetical protein
MSMRHSIFHHENEETGVVIHIFEDFELGAHGDNRLEVEFPQGTINVPWLREAFAEEMLQRASPKRVTPEEGKLLLEGNS